MGDSPLASPPCQGAISTGTTLRLNNPDPAETKGGLTNMCKPRHPYWVDIVEAMRPFAA